MPIQIKKTTGGTAYASPFLDDAGGRIVQVKVDVSALSTNEVDEYGWLKPGVPLTLDGLLPSNPSGTKQVEAATVVGTIGSSGAGNVAVVVTANGMNGSPKTLSVAVANNDTASQVAGKIRTALLANEDVNDFFDVSGSGASVVLTAKVAAANDATLNISVDNDTSTGLTAAPTSANTTAGVAPADNGAVVMVESPAQIADGNTGLSSITNDPFVACRTHGLANRDIIEDNLGRALTAAELAALKASGNIVLTLT